MLIDDVTVHISEMLVGAYDGKGRAIETLKTDDFTVIEQEKKRAVREVTLLKNSPLSLGIAIDMSNSLYDFVDAEEKSVLGFLDSIMTSRDAVTLYGIENFTRTFIEWSTDREAVKSKFLELTGYMRESKAYYNAINKDMSRIIEKWREDNKDKNPDEWSTIKIPKVIVDGKEIDIPAPETQLYEMIDKALYAFQGEPGARALILVTDGYDNSCQHKRPNIEAVVQCEQEKFDMTVEQEKSLSFLQT